MILVYGSNTTSFSSFGEAVLYPLSANVKKKINGVSGLTIVVDLNQGQYLEPDNIIKAEDQLYRIIRTKKTGNDKENLEIYAENIVFTDLIDGYVSDFVYENINPQQALTNLLVDTIFTTGQCDVFDPQNISVTAKNKLSALHEILEYWQAELHINGLEISIKQAIGADNGVRIQNGKNLKGIEYNEDISNVITRLNYVNKDLTLGGSIDSPYISNYANVKNGYVELEAETQEELDTLALAYLYSADKPYINYSIDLVELEYTEEYSKFKSLEHIELGDTVVIEHQGLGINISARILETDQDILEHMNTSVVLGNFAENYFNYQVSLNQTKQVVDYSFSKDRKLNYVCLMGLKIPKSSGGTAFEVTEDGVIIDIGDNTDITTMKGSISANSAAIIVNSDAIQAAVSSISSIDGRVTENTASITVNAEQIALKVSETDFNGNEIVSKINMSTTTIDISADKINLTGYVTVTDLANTGSTIINGNNITTGTIDADRIATDIAQVNSVLSIGNLSDKSALIEFYRSGSSYAEIKTSENVGGLDMFCTDDMIIGCNGDLDIFANGILQFFVTGNIYGISDKIAGYGLNGGSYTIDVDTGIIATRSWVDDNYADYYHTHSDYASSSHNHGNDYIKSRIGEDLSIAATEYGIVIRRGDTVLGSLMFA